MTMYRKSAISVKKSNFSDESENEGSVDGGFIVDPEKIFDELPQPYRLVDKTLNYIFDKVWEAIQKIEDEKNELGAGGRVPIFDCARPISHFVQPTLFCSSFDGKYVFVVAKTGGLYVFDSLESSVVASNEELHGISVVSLSASYFDGDKYFICGVLENGLSAVFAFSNSTLHLMKVFNEEISVKNSATTCIKISGDGNFIAVGWEIAPSKSSWLEIYKVPKEIWINEIEQAEKEANLKKQTDQLSTHEEDTANSLKNDSSDSEGETASSRPTSANQDATHVGFVVETAFSKPPLLLKVKSPTNVVANTASNVPAALKMVDVDSVITGSNHVLMQQYFDNSLATFKNTYQQYLQYFGEEESVSTRLPTIHFLTPGKLIPSGCEKADDVNSIIVHWSDSSHAFLYSLLKTTKDVERKPDVMLRTSCRISVSAVSACGRFLSFCLENNNVVTWNILQGVALNVIKLSRTGLVASLYFLPANSGKNSTGNTLSEDSIKLLACCQNGDVHMIKCEQNNQASTLISFRSSLMAKDPVTQVSYIPNIPQLVVLQRHSGRIAIMDTKTNTVKCQVGLIKPLVVLPGFCYTHQTSTLYIKGGQKDEYDEELLPESVSIFTMNIDSFPVLKCYEKKSYSQTQTRNNNNKGLAQRIEQMETERTESEAKRERRRQTRWRQFEGELNRMKSTTLGNSAWLAVK